MKEVLKSIFVENNFDTEEITDFIGIDSFLAKRNKTKKVNFFIVVFLEQQKLGDLNLEKITKLSEDIKEIEAYEPSMDKNTSLLICLKHESSIDDELQKTIFNIEEDPYDFKKYLLIYSSEQVNAMNNNLSFVNGPSNIMKEFNSLLLNTERFNKFKEKKEADLTYELITKIFIKLPFIMIELDEEKEMLDIQNIIDQKIKASEHPVFTKSRALEFGELLYSENVDEEKLIKDIYRMGGIMNGEI